MNILQLIFFISFLLIINAQWYIKKTYQTKLMPYPNPGKRTLPKEQTNFVERDCSRPFSQLNSYQERINWIYTCIYSKSPLKINENSFSSNLNNLEVESPSTRRLIRREIGSPHVVSSYFTEHNNSFNKLLMKLLQGRSKSQ
jgi:hypothetical protein